MNIMETMTRIMHREGLSPYAVSRRMGRANNYIATSIKKNTSVTISTLKEFCTALDYEIVVRSKHDDYEIVI